MPKDTIPYEEFQKMVRLAPPNSGITPQSIAASLEKKGYTLAPELSQYSTMQPQERTEGKESFFSWISDHINSPFDVASGLLNKEASRISGQIGFSAGEDAGQKVFKQQYTPENLKQAATTARVVPAVAAGLATGGASLPVSAAISGAVGAGSSLVASGLEAAAGDQQSATGVATEAAVSGLSDAALDAATRGLFSMAKPFFKAKGAASLTDDLSKTIGRVVQSTDEDISSAKNALREIDTSSITTYEELAKAVKDKSKGLLAAQDEILNSVPKIHPIKTFTKTVGEGRNSVKMNFVERALDGLEELYTKSGAAEDLVRIRNLKNAKGLSAKNINDLAREYGRGFKAFSDASGQPLTSVNAKMYENVRKGLKEVSRGLMPNNATKAIDESLTSLITTGELADNMVDSVRKLTNKLETRGILSQIASKIGGGVDLMLGRTPSSLFTSLLLRGNVGQKTLNSLQLQEALPKNLKMIQKLTEQLDTLPEGQVLGRMKEIFGSALENTTSAAAKGTRAVITNELQN